MAIAGLAHLKYGKTNDEGFKLYEELYNKGINLIFLKEPHINTDTYRKILQDKKISLKLNSGDEATDKLM